MRSLIASGLFLALLLSSGCNDATSPPPPANPGAPGEVVKVKEGVWGGSDSVLTVDATGAQFKRDCDSGSVSVPLTLDERGGFDFPGTVTASHGGPISPDDIRPARFQGTVSGDAMDLTVTFTEAGDDSPTTWQDHLTFGFEGPTPGICPL